MAYLSLINLITRARGKKYNNSFDRLEILITGTFYSDNWLESHLRPLALSSRCSRVVMVASKPVPRIGKVEAIYPPVWLCKMFGEVGGRLTTFVWTAVKIRPQVVGGFHLLINGMVASLVARIIGARSLYFCGGGPREVMGGGYATESRIFNKIRTPDPVLERQLLKAVNTTDMVITMGSGAAGYFRGQGISSNIFINPGGFDGKRYHPADTSPSIDLILIGRLSRVKRVDMFLEAIKNAKEFIPDISAVIVGDGPERASLEKMSIDMGLESKVSFVGHQPDVASWIRKSKIFVLTSDSEGVSLAMMESMLCGVPPIVSDVGDLSDIVIDGTNGYLVSERTPAAFSEKFVQLLSDEGRLKRFSKEARITAGKYELETVSRKWDDIFSHGHQHNEEERKS